MILTQLKIILRILLKSKKSTFINIFCLSIGLVASVLIFQYVFYEFSYDKNLKDSELVYRVKQKDYNQGKLSSETVAACGSIGLALSNNYPEIQDFVRLYHMPRRLLIQGDHSFIESKIYYSTSSFFKVFPYKILKGNKDSLLEEPFHIVLIEKMAKKYFGNENPVGKIIKINNRRDYIVDAVCENPPDNTHFKFDFLVSWSTWNIPYSSIYGVKEINDENLWNYTGFFTYIKLYPKFDPKALEDKIPNLVEEKYGETMRAENNKLTIDLQPLEKIHLYSNFSGEIEKNGNWKTTYFLMFIAILILIIAWFNYVNLSTAKSIERAKEIGLKKVFGANKSNLIWQFVLETFIINFIAIVIAFVFIVLLKPKASELIGKNVNFIHLFHNVYWYIGIAIYIGCTIFIGLFTGFVLSSFQPIKVLKGKLKNTSNGLSFRKSLVVFQFIVSLILIASTMIIFKQVSFMQNRDKNFDSDNILVIPGAISTDTLYRTKIQAFKSEIKQKIPIDYLCASAYVPGQEPDWKTDAKFYDKDDNTSVFVNVLPLDYDFFKVYNLELVKGRFFSRDYGNDENCILLNETAMRLMGCNNPDSIINKRISYWGKDYEVIGIIKNYNHESLIKNIDPFIFSLWPNISKFYSLKLKFTKSDPQLINEIKNIWEQQFPLVPFDYFFLEDMYQQQYNDENQFGNVFFVFSLLAIIIACLGLYGSASYAAIQRTKEVGVRKVLGASNIQIVTIFLTEDLKLILIALIIGLPICYNIMNKWLMDFAYRINISWWLLVISSLIVIIISILTVSSILIKSANNNPVESLKYE